MAKQNEVQRKVKEIGKIQAEFGGYRPDLINMYFAVKLKRLTTILIWLTAILSALVIVQIVLLA